ncbi:MAG TPA: M48 family metallopeptidase [Thermoleophilaceae bacterium]|nr:M48 family metallopeptidase [Thermoleophilaceae bacterium]
MTEQIEAAWKLDRISPRAYQHPADRAASAGLAKVPYLDEVVRKLVALGYERALRAASLGSAVRLGQHQLPRIWVLHRQVFNALDMDRVPDLYVTQFPLANAYAIGTDKPIVLLNSELVRILDDDGHRVVLAHEAAHVHSDHVLYQTALLILLRLGSSVRLPILAGLPLLAIKLALLEWWRAAELSCDRAAALVTRDPQAVCRSLMTIAAGEEVENLNLDAFIAQGMEYSESGTGLERMTRLLQDLNVTHPMPVRRVKMLLDWVQEGGYDRMVRGDYLRRGEEPTAREEADSAGVFYAERISGAFAQAGSSVADVGQQLGDWLKRTRERGGGGGASGEE